MTWQIQAAMDLRRRGVPVRSVTSARSDYYNCIAWALRDQSQWWWPGGKGFWPGRPPEQNIRPTLDVFLALFAARDFVQCEGASVEAGYEKIALYGIGDEVTHAARQLASGFWTSKLGEHVDVEHELSQIEVPPYGSVIAFLRRRLPVP